MQSRHFALSAIVLAFVILGLAAPLRLRAQERPFDVTPCQLVAHPEKYNEGMVMVEGILTYSSQDFSLHSAECGDQHGQIWLEFGGDVGDPTSAAKRQPGTNVKVEGGEISLTRDKDFDRLQAMLRKIGASGEKKMLRVTLTGKFFSGKPAKLPDGNVRYHGYGYMGCCSLLVIERVESVGAELEDAVDFGPLLVPTDNTGFPKTCVTTSLPVPSREDEDKLQRLSLRDEYRYLHDPEEVAARTITETAGLSTPLPVDKLEVFADFPSSKTYSWDSPEGAILNVRVSRPYWLLATTNSGDMVIWVPTEITRTACGLMQK